MLGGRFLKSCIRSDFCNKAPENYPSIIEQLIYFKDDRFKIFYGGPIDNGSGVRWLMPALFEDEGHKTRAVYEISFVNCLPRLEDAKEAEVLYFKVSDIDIKFQNCLSEEYKIFSEYINNMDANRKCILIREVDLSNIYYPEIFIAAIDSEFKSSDRDAILDFLNRKFGVQKALRDLGPKKSIPKKRSFEAHEGLIEQKRVATRIEGVEYTFNVDHYYIHNDPWKSYYLVTRDGKSIADLSKVQTIFLRIDSGCESGQVYQDDSCDCLDQFLRSLQCMGALESENSLLIHIPAHDGRGFGVAPKAETEIYKRGGIGRVNRTEPLDTVQAAILLYRTGNFDIRTYEGCARLLISNDIWSVDLLTDNKFKIQSMESFGVAVNRRKTNTDKQACRNHIMAKKNYKNYFPD